MPKGIKSRKRKEGEKLVSMTFYCPKLNREVLIPASEAMFSGDSYECDMCGSHGRTDVWFKCWCEGNHTVELNSW